MLQVWDKEMPPNWVVKSPFRQSVDMYVLSGKQPAQIYLIQNPNTDWAINCDSVLWFFGCDTRASSRAAKEDDIFSLQSQGEA